MGWFWVTMFLSVLMLLLLNVFLPRQSLETPNAQIPLDYRLCCSLVAVVIPVAWDCSTVLPSYFVKLIFPGELLQRKQPTISTLLWYAPSSIPGHYSRQDNCNGVAYRACLSVYPVCCQSSTLLCHGFGDCRGRRALVWYAAPGRG